MTELLVNIDVDDLERAVAFYTAAFGLTVKRRFGDRGVELGGANAPIFFLAKPAGSVPAAGAAPRDYRRHWTPVHLDFIVDDIEAAHRRVLAAGARAESEIETQGYGRFAQLADPFGNGLCLIQFVGRGYDEISSLVAQGEGP